MSITKSLLFLPLAALCVAQTAPHQVPTPGTPPPAAAPSAPKAGLKMQDVGDTDPVVLTVGAETMKRSEFERLIDALPPQVRAQAQGPGKKKLAEQLGELIAMAQESRRRGLDQKSEVKELLKFQTDQVLATSLFKELANNAKSNEAAERAYYDAHKDEYQQVTARHILIRFKGSPVKAKPNTPELTPEEALAKIEAIRKRLLAGEDFATVAKAESEDTTNAANGGSLGSFSRGRMVPEFEQAAFSLPVGQVSEPIKTQFGYHLIKVDSRSPQAFDEVRQQIQSKLAQQAVEDVRKKATITLNDNYFSK